MPRAAAADGQPLSAPPATPPPMTPRILVPLLLSCLLLSGPGALQAQEAERLSAPEIAHRLDAYLTLASAYGFSGAVLVAERGEVLLHRGYGLADRAAGTRLEGDTPLHIGSLGKQFTAAAILHLEAAGRLSTEDRLERFFPEAPEDKRAITLHQLLSHTSGLPYLTTRSFMEERPRAEVMAEMLELPLGADPGARYAYSSPGYTLLAGVVERVTGESYEAYLQRELFAAAGLRRTGPADDPRWHAAGVWGYSAQSDQGQPLAALGAIPKAVGAGSIVSTVHDLYLWDRALQGDAVLPAAARARFFAPAAAIAEGRDYAYGWMVSRNPRGETVVHHGGDLGAFNSDLRRYVERDLVIVVASNARLDGRGHREVALAALNRLLSGSELTLPPEALPATGREAALAGEYEAAPDGRFRVRAGQGGLRIGGSGEAALLALSGVPDSAAHARSRELSRRAAAVASALGAGDAEPLREHLHASRSFAGTSRWLLEEYRALADSLGAFRGVRTRGTAILSPTAARSYLDLLYEGGAYPVAYAWGSEKITGFEAEYEIPLETLFLPVGEDLYASHDLFTGRTLEARFQPGGPSALSLGAPGAAPLTAARVAGAAPDLTTIDGIVGALYEVISGGVGEPRDWERFRSLFRPGARMIPTGRNAAGEPLLLVWDPEEYIARNREVLERIGFVEREIARRTEAWGDIAQLFSAYEAFREGQGEPFLRGINAIQLWNDGTRWWIVSVMWEAERPENPLP
jgi:CubicO group peptidase (beta-lactamase class C family)